MNQTLRPFIGKSVVVYFEDFLVFSSSITDHLSHLRDVLVVLCAAKLFGVAKKCDFGVLQVLFFGYIVYAQGFEVDPTKIFAIHTWPALTLVTEI